jgi:hypothetical protein
LCVLVVIETTIDYTANKTKNYYEHIYFKHLIYLSYQSSGDLKLFITGPKKLLQTGRRFPKPRT